MFSLAVLAVRVRRTATLLAVLSLLAVSPARAVVPAGAEDEVHHLLTLLGAVGDEYREGVHDGAVVRPLEFEEAKIFLQDAEQRFAAVAVALPAGERDLSPLFAEVAAVIEQKLPVDTVDAKLAALRQRVMAVTGVSEQVYPPAAPSAVRGKALFAEHCATCHGERGDGKGPGAAALNPPPASFADPRFMRAETPYDFYHVISLGKSRSGMPAWDGVLSVQERWDLVSYLWTFAPGDAGIAEGQGVYLAHCAACHGATGNGRGIFSNQLVSGPPDLSTPQAIARKPDAELFAATTAGVAGTPMASFARTLSEDERWKAVAFLRLLSHGGPAQSANSGSGGSDVKPLEDATAPTTADAALAESTRLLEAAVAAYGRGDSQATSLAADAYLEFEPLETRLGATHPGLKTSVEEHFLRVRQLLRTTGNEAEIGSLAAAIRGDLAAARTALQPHSSSYGLFLQSATIILREGFEVVLVIGALLAYVVKSGNVAMQRSIYAGTIAGLVASVATAFVMDELLRFYPGSSAMLEGMTMLLAAAVLFLVSYWLVSKSEADKWQRYIRGKVHEAMSNGRSVALASAAFLAVYREGFETVLFYQALYGSAPATPMTVTAGCIAGSVALLVVYVLFRRFQVQIPIRQFFFVTGLFLYAMAAVFAGQGVHELQEAGIIGVTPINGVPAIPLLGIYPSLESLALQGVFVVLLIYATVVTLRRSRRAPAEGQGADVLTELRALRAAIDALRAQLVAYPTGESTATGDRVQGLLIRAEQLVGELQPAPPANGRSRRNGH